MNKNLSEYIHLNANEPSIGLFHVQEHVKKTVPKLVETKVLFYVFEIIKFCSGILRVGFNVLLKLVMMLIILC